MNLTIEQIKKAKVTPCKRDPRSEDANLQLVELGGGFYLCKKDREGDRRDTLFTAQEVKDLFNNEDKVVIIFKNESNVHYPNTSVANFDNRI